MPIILILLLALLIAQVGFWDALGAILGAAAMVVLFVLMLSLRLCLEATFCSAGFDEAAERVDCA